MDCYSNSCFSASAISSWRNDGRIWKWVWGHDEHDVQLQLWLWRNVDIRLAIHDCFSCGACFAHCVARAADSESWKEKKMVAKTLSVAAIFIIVIAVILFVFLINFIIRVAILILLVLAILWLYNQIKKQKRRRKW